MFGQCSGLMMNKEKTEAMLLGQWGNVQNAQYDINWTKWPYQIIWSLPQQKSKGMCDAKLSIQN